jgi:hypothetical protein
VTQQTMQALRRPAVAGATAAAAAALWLVAVRAGDAILAPVAIAVALAIVVVLGAARLADRLDAAPAARAALIATGAGVAAAVGGLAVGETVGALALGRDLLAALAVTVPVATALGTVRMPVRAPQTPAVDAVSEPPCTRATTRRRFIQAGAVSGAAVAGVAARVAPAGAQDPLPFEFTICEGERRMVDGTPLWIRGFRLTSAQDDRPTLPGPPLGNTGPGVRGREIFEGEQIRMVIRNETPRDHTFLIDRGASERPADPIVGPITIPARGRRQFDFTAPSAGTYIYRDADRNNRILGMAGVVIVQPVGVGGRLLPYAPAPDRVPIDRELRGQWVWALNDLDPVLGEYARARRNVSELEFPLSKILPRYFFLNGQAGDEATKNTNLTVPVLPLLQGAAASTIAGVLIRCVNLGIAHHSLHWHGNHVFQVELNGRPARAGVVFERDMQRMPPLTRASVVLPAHTGYEAFPPLKPDVHPKANDQHFPMHCHAEMSQTMAGGAYPFGMLTDWHLVADEHAAERVKRRLTDQRLEGRSLVPQEEVLAAAKEAGATVPTSGSGGKGRGRGRGRGRSGGGGSSGSNSGTSKDD